MTGQFAQRDEGSGVMSVPMCPTCQTDEHLQYENFTPGRNDPLSIPTMNGDVIRHDRWVGPVVRYRCAKCGYFGGHTVPDDWTVPVR